MKAKLTKLRISEKQRTIMLVVLLLFSICFIYYIQHGIDNNFVEQLQ